MTAPAAAPPSRPARSKAPRELTALAPASMLPGLGPASEASLRKNGFATVADLLWLPPVAWDDLRAPIGLTEALTTTRDALASGLALAGPRLVVSAVVKSASMVPLGRRRGVRVVVHDEGDTTCTLHAFWFFHAPGILKACTPGTRVLLAGRIRIEPKKPARTAHPDVFVDGPDLVRVRARYPKVGPNDAALRKAIGHALAAGMAPDPVPAPVASREAFPPVKPVLEAVHGAGEGPPDGAAMRGFVERLAWAEAFTRVAERLELEARGAEVRARALPPSPESQDALVRALGFRLTASQDDAVRAVSADLARDRPMRRLLLGDVGTGKTAVALAAVAQCVAAGEQAAILAPTSVLAEQYRRAAEPLARATGAKIAFVAAGADAATRRASEAALRTGEALVAIGTHALLDEGVVLPKLSLVVVDEQQRLGVAQRLALVAKGRRPHLLALSATPIPRTLALALHGELDVSRLEERPEGRLPVATTCMSLDDEAEVLARVRRAVDEGDKVFWIVPRVDGDDEDDAKTSLEARAKRVEAAVGKGAVLTISGAVKAEDKRRTMAAFREGPCHVLVGTTVLEVGVDVPAATLMVIEEASRFGLSQLHQLRGRVGRGTKPGSCVLLHAPGIEGAARARLEALLTLDRGEDVARADLALRGAGDLAGTRQHGAEEAWLYLDPATPRPWMDRLEGDARAILARDPALALPEHEVLGVLRRRLGRAILAREEAG